MKTIGIREFLRGAYKDITEPVMVMSNNRPLAVWTPEEEVNSVPVSSGYFTTPSYYPSTSTTVASTSEWTIDPHKTFTLKKK